MLSWVQQQGLTPVAWEEALFTTNAAPAGTVINTWSHATPGAAIDRGHHVIASSMNHWYVSSQRDPAQTWYSPLAELSDEQKPFLLGAEASMWTDNYCFAKQCGAFSGDVPPDAALYPPEKDALFASSIAGTVWPQTSIAAGAFWRYDSSLNVTSDRFRSLLDAHNYLLRLRGVDVCPNGCTCDSSQRCGRPYA